MFVTLRFKRGNIDMLIPVIYPDGKHDLVKDFYLSHLISTEKILQFKRSSGWISITAANVRGENKNSHYHGPESRLQELVDAESQTIEFF